MSFITLHKSILLVIFWPVTIDFASILANLESTEVATAEDHYEALELLNYTHTVDLEIKVDKPIISNTAIPDKISQTKRRDRRIDSLSR